MKKTLGSRCELSVATNLDFRMHASIACYQLINAWVYNTNYVTVLIQNTLFLSIDHHSWVQKNVKYVWADDNYLSTRRTDIVIIVNWLLMKALLNMWTVIHVIISIEIRPHTSLHFLFHNTLGRCTIIIHEFNGFIMYACWCHHVYSS